MPELPEVETTRLGLLPLEGQTVASVEIRFPTLRWPIPEHLSQSLAGHQLLNIQRRAKYLLCQFKHGVLLLHLGMSGRLCLLDDHYPPEKHDHFDVVFSNGHVMRLHDPRRFGAVLWLDKDEVDTHALLANLGPEPLSGAFNADYLFAQLQRKKKAIKTAIMDSQLVVGVGNIYAAESLFRARIHPETQANALSKAQCQRLVETIKQTLEAALAAGGSSLRDFFGADGNPGYFQQTYYVYGRTGEPCRECGDLVRCIRLGQRSTFFCEQCQPR